jgi:hypothetical protein
MHYRNAPYSASRPEKERPESCSVRDKKTKIEMLEIRWSRPGSSVEGFTDVPETELLGKLEQNTRTWRVPLD